MEVQHFIAYCKSEKIKSFKIQDVEVVISELAYVPDINEPVAQDYKLDSGDILSDAEDEKFMTEKEKEELLFWSTKG